MIRIYSGEDKLPKGIICIGSNKGFFHNHISARGLDDYDKKVMMDIDNSEVTDVNNSKIYNIKFKTVASLRDLSSGCKTVLNAHYILKNNITGYAINSVNCGGNALSYLYDLCNDTDLVILQRPVVFGEAYTKHNIIYNDGEFKGCFDDYTDFMLAKSMEGYKE